MRRVNPDRPLSKSERNTRYYEQHKSEEHQRGQKYRQENRDKELARGLFYRHSVTSDWFEEKLESQQNRCAICRAKFTRPPHLDHSHLCCSGRRSCGKCCRGILCDDCNIGLGRFKDSIEVLSNAIEYLKGYKQ